MATETDSAEDLRIELNIQQRLVLRRHSLIKPISELSIDIRRKFIHL